MIYLFLAEHVEGIISKWLSITRNINSLVIIIIILLYDSWIMILQLLF